MSWEDRAQSGARIRRHALNAAAEQVRDQHKGCVVNFTDASDLNTLMQVASLMHR